MATTPSSPLLGAVSGPGRSNSQAGAKAAAPGDDTEGKSNFSKVLQNARGQDNAPAPTSVAKDKSAAQSTDKTARADSDGSEAAGVSGNQTPKTAAKGLQTGKVLPAGGEELPLPITVDPAAAVAVSAKSTATAGSDTDSDTDATATTDKQRGDKHLGDKHSDAADAAAVAAAGTPPVLPATAAATAAAALASRHGGKSSAGSEDTDTAISDATSSQKRQVPAPAQALKDAAVAAVPGDADNGTQAAGAAAGEPVPAGGLTAAGLATGKTPGKASAGTGADATSAMAVERASFRDTLKRMDGTLTASPGSGDSSAASVQGAGQTPTDNGVRQYLDTSAATATINVPVGKPGWSDAVADKVMWMSAQNLHSAEIHLNPPDLGPLSVRVNTHHDQTSVFFTSQHADVRNAIDQSLPRLREMMGSSGAQLLDVGVGGQAMAGQQQHSQASQGGQYQATAGLSSIAAAGVGAVDTGAVVTRPVLARSLPGLLDAYA